MENAVLVLQCPDHEGIIARITEFVFRHGGNITRSNQFSTDPAQGRFFLRMAFGFDDTARPRARLEEDFRAVGDSLAAEWRFHYASDVQRMGILVSQHDHCLFDLLYRWKSGELRVDIPMVLGNHENVRGIVEWFGIPFHYIPVNPADKPAAEQAILDQTRGATDFLVLARYMQILSPGFLRAYGRDVINIHHSFLPSFKGANPYRQAYERGVKLIGATAHFATPELDEGPIIDQMVERATHADHVEDLRRKGQHVEKAVLARALHAYLEHRVIRYGNKTIVFE